MIQNLALTPPKLVHVLPPPIPQQTSCSTPSQSLKSQSKRILKNSGNAVYMSILDLIAVCVAIRKLNSSQATCVFFFLFVIYVNML